MRIVIDFFGYIPPEDKSMWIEATGNQLQLNALCPKITAKAADVGFLGSEDDRRRLKVDKLLRKLEKAAAIHFQELENKACRKKLYKVSQKIKKNLLGHLPDLILPRL